MKLRKSQPPTTHRVAVFVRVDVEVEGDPSPDLYDEIGDVLQDGIEDFLLADGSKLDLKFTTARVLGPLSEEDVRQLDAPDGTSFEPLLEYLESAPGRD